VRVTSERIEVKSPDQIKLMRRAGLVVADALDAVRAALRPGVTTLELDGIAEHVIRSAGATPSFLGYGRPAYPATTCISVNDEVVHGIPGGRVVRAGDIVSVDCGAVLAGWHGDSAFSAIVTPEEAPDADPSDATLVDVTEQAMWRASPPSPTANASATSARASRTSSAAGSASWRSTAGTGTAPRCTRSPAGPTT